MDTKNFFKDYQSKLIELINQINLEKLSQAAKILLTAYQNKKTVIVIGNGGSASTASHIVCDLSKTVRGHEGDSSWLGFRILNLSDNVGLITAWANDAGYEKVYSGQLENWGQKDDILIAISSSGNSKNIISAVLKAKQLGMKTIGIAGFGGGELAKIVDVALVSSFHEYGLVEDVQLILGHMLTNYFWRYFQEVIKK